MVEKFGRNYQLRVEETFGGQFKEIGLPFTLEFDIIRNHFASPNSAKIRIYNLNENTRALIRKNSYDYTKIMILTLKAGYGQKMSIVANGNVTEAFSVREGHDFVTEISSFDVGAGIGVMNAVTNKSVPANTQIKDIYSSLVEDLAQVGINPGVVGSYPGNIQRGNSYSGNTMDILSQMSGGGAFVDNGKINVIQDNEVIATTGELTIDASSGLLNTPRIEQLFIEIDILFEPSVKVGQQINLKSTTNPILNGSHKVKSIHHKGTISDAVCGDAMTTLGLIPGDFRKVLPQ